jgi:hypothetical protein
MTECFGQYAASDYSLPEFTKRYYGLKASKTGMDNCSADYAGSANKLSKQ